MTTLKDMKKNKKTKNSKNPHNMHNMHNMQNMQNMQTLDEKLGDRNDLTIKRLVRRLERASDAYYNGTVPILSDQQYDYMLDKLKQLDPENKFLKKVGSTPPDDQKITLPTQMGSLEKTRPSGINEWLRKLDKKCTLVVTPKLDGFSGLLHYRNGKLLAVYTRGDGVVGRSVTNKAKSVNGVVTHDFAPKGAKNATKTDKCFHIKGDVFVKGEFVIHDTIFNKYYKGEGGYRNARNFVVGMINRQGKDKYVTKALKRMCFVSYSLECPNDKRLQGIDKHDQLATLRQLGFITVDRPWLPRSKKKEARLQKLYDEKYQNLSGFAGPKKHRKTQRSKDQRKSSRKIQNEIDKLSGKPYSGQILPISVSKPSSVDGYTLRKYIQFMQLNCDIQQDGLVIEVNEHNVVKKMGYEANGLNPVWARSIKLEQEDQQSKIGKVQRISWNYTKRSILKPTVVLKEPLSFKGVEVTNVFAHNAKYVKDNGIYPGVKVKVIRSGDVVPYILDVIHGK